MSERNGMCCGEHSRPITNKPKREIKKLCFFCKNSVIIIAIYIKCSITTHLCDDYVYYLSCVSSPVLFSLPMRAHSRVFTCCHALWWSRAHVPVLRKTKKGHKTPAEPAGQSQAAPCQHVCVYMCMYVCMCVFSSSVSSIFPF